ncbi:MAG: hypothetical protein HZB55_08560 [Deltaproteobacteria bacterium]|nr:hypothetical protein [Deltaproteobacteria bacterium]
MGGWSRAAIRRGAMVLLVLGLSGLGLGCGSQLSEEDRLLARAAVERAVRSATYEQFLTSFPAEDQARMRESPVWIRWWQEKFEKQRGAWTVASVKGRADGSVEVTTDHRRRPTSHQFYRLVKDGPAWKILDIESQW